MLPLLPFAAGLLVGAAAIAALRDPRARATLNRAQDGLRRAGRAGIKALTPHRAEEAAPAAEPAPAARKPRRTKAKPATAQAAATAKAAKAPRTAKPRRAKTETPA